MKTPGCRDVEGYCVFQSTSMACFSPIFSDQLTAEIFASALHDIYPKWDDKSVDALSTRVLSFIHEKLGDDPEDHEDYMDYLCSSDRQADLLAQFRLKPAA